MKIERILQNASSHLQKGALAKRCPLVYRDTAARARAAKINEKFPSASSDSTPSQPMTSIIDTSDGTAGSMNSNERHTHPDSKRKSSSELVIKRRLCSAAAKGSTNVDVDVDLSQNGKTCWRHEEKVGDTSIDLPEANVIIQVSSHFGSRRQEAQRLGRILRPKSYTQTDGSNRSSFNAFFYTLVSTDTQEMFYSTKRQQYLIDQGYTFKIVTTLSEKADLEALQNDYAYKNAEDDRQLLRIVLTSDIEKDQCAEDTAIRKSNPDGAKLADLGAKRTAGSTLAQLSGGSGARYSSGPRKIHPMFAKRRKARM